MAQASLPALLAGMKPGEQIVIVQDGVEIAKLTRSGPQQQPCEAGAYRKAEFWMAPDFDAPLEEFKEYMTRQPRQPGNCKGMLTIGADDDEHLKDFAEYM